MQYNDLKQWIKNGKCKNNRMYNKLFASYNTQTKKLKKLEEFESTLLTENNKCQDLNNRITEQLKTLNSSEQRLQMEIEELEKLEKCILNKLNDTQVNTTNIDGYIFKIQIIKKIYIKR